MNAAKMLQTKQFKSLWNREMIKKELGIKGLYAIYNIKTHDVNIYEFMGKIYTEVNDLLVWSEDDLVKIWNNKDLV